MPVKNTGTEKFWILLLNKQLIRLATLSHVEQIHDTPVTDVLDKLS
jgi:hypothetical protein